jgi:hypothetical protein
MDSSSIEINLDSLGSDNKTINTSPIKLNIDDINNNALDTSDIQDIDLGTDNSIPGIELLMNDKKIRKGGESRRNSGGDSLGLSDPLNLDSLEDDLNKLTGETINIDNESKPVNTILNDKININIQKEGSESQENMNINDEKPQKSKSGWGGLGSFFGNSKKKTVVDDNPASNTEATWDGFKKFNEIPQQHAPKVEMSKEELLRAKFNILKKLEELERKGIQLSKKYSMESDLLEMEGEYESIKAERERKNSVKFQRRMMMAAVTGLEFLNNRFDPFDFKLDGWGEQVNENIDDYDEIFGELHEKYQSKAKIAPELKLLFQLGGSAIMLHMTNTMFKSSIPGMDDIMRQNPELMEQFTKAAVNQMGQSNPGFGNFMGGVMNNQQQPRQSQRYNEPPPHVMNNGRPPSPMETKNRSRMDNRGPRPDIAFGRASNNPSATNGDGISISKGNLFESPEQSDPPERSVRRPRPEMRGPSQEVNDLIAGLKKKDGKGKSGNSRKNNTISLDL